MHKSTPSRWIEQAEARAVLEQAILQRAASEPHAVITYISAGRSGFDWLRELPRMLRRTVTAIRSVSVNAMIWINRRPRVASILLSARLDDGRKSPE